jgi:protein-disulfide isomerase
MNRKKMFKNPWIISTAILGIIILVLLIVTFLPKGISANTNIIPAEEAGNKLVEFLNSRTGGGVEFVSSDDAGNLYEVTVSYQGESLPVFITKDGEYFVQAAVPLDEDLQVQQPSQPSQNQPTQPSQQPSQPSQNTQTQVYDVSADDDPFIGDINAPVTIIEFSDFECPFCTRFYKNTLPQLKKDYIDTGKARLVYRDFPLGFHSNAQKSAEAAECADDQNKFSEMHDKLFDEGVSGGVTSFKQFAKDLGLNTAEFDNCLDSGKYSEEVQKDLEDGQSLGVSGTPTFFINGKKLVGAQPFEAFKQIIDQELS